jgi:hypothetical protein
MKVLLKNNNQANQAILCILSACRAFVNIGPAEQKPLIADMPPAI